jgi:hypothetical protein
MQVATPALSVTALHRVVLPKLNVTEPVGVPPWPVTVAVKVTACPGAEGFGDEVRLVALACPTT